VTSLIDTSVYVHFPFCARKCPYCDFATRAIAPAEVPHVAYADAVLRELDDRAPSLADRRLVSVFFGGGTPSLWEPRELGRVLRAILAAFPVHGDLEISAECNPSSFDDARAEGLREAGIGRISLGVQSLEDSRLKFLGRLHDSVGALAALRRAVARFDRVSGDLMFGMPGQTPEALALEIARIVETGIEHVSAYSLTVEPGTVFSELARAGRLPLAPEEDSARMFVEAESVFGGLGFGRYEVSNYARPGAEARHNQHYWRGGAYLGLGAAAVGALDDGVGRGRRYRNQPEAPAYLASTNVDREESTEPLDAQTIIREALMLGLRTREGVDLSAVAARAGVALHTGRERSIARAIERGDLVDDGVSLIVPRDRWLRLDGIVADLF
jgi:putative oxygen-independent coproporphyrinogen III oxidase